MTDHADSPKRILVTAQNSFIGNSFGRWIAANYNGKYCVDYISCRDESWKEKTLAGYDVILHVAGIAHIKETKINVQKYYEVNRDLTVALAERAKAEGVRQFIFISSMSVYGLESGIITSKTIPNPTSAYGASKLQAEEHLKNMANVEYKLAIIRPPMVYGVNSKGNYERLKGIALKTPVFPKYRNSRSMIYVDNLSEFIRLIIDDCSSGVFFPQNREYVETSEMVQLIAKAHNKNVRLSPLFNPLLYLIKKRFKFVNKVFGNLVYEKDLSLYKMPYWVADFSQSIQLTEKSNVYEKNCNPIES